MIATMIRKTAVTFTLDADVIEALEKYATAQRTSKSALVNRTLAEQLCGDPGRWFVFRGER
jgi:predicted transcriptional regulator